jgi:hypothetical protein
LIFFLDSADSVVLFTVAHPAISNDAESTAAMVLLEIKCSSVFVDEEWLA